MLTNLFLNFVVLIVGAVFSFLPTVTALPTIGGYDIDTALVSGVGQLNFFMGVFWPIGDMFAGFLVLMGYYALKMLLQFLFGHRAPGVK